MCVCVRGSVLGGGRAKEGEGSMWEGKREEGSEWGECVCVCVSEGGKEGGREIAKEGERKERGIECMCILWCRIKLCNLNPSIPSKSNNNNIFSNIKSGIEDPRTPTIPHISQMRKKEGGRRQWALQIS